ncbi:MAG: hypothetical protein GXY44_00530 [Phycisphaerales bacterium]|nr:hypothetical protein [Phycisphaerales bacterium]
MAYLLINIDTEEEGLFGACYPRDDWRLGHLTELPRLQDIFDRFGVRPTYQVTTPVVQDRVGSAYLQEYLDAGRCDIGGHLHPWATEPYAEPADAAHSMPCLLPLDSVRRKLTTLTQQIHDRFGIQPVTYRSGRYGSAAMHTPILLKLGYRVETSVCPFVSHTEYDGPDYTHAPLEPYWLGEQDMLERQSEGRLLCVPISAGFNVRHFRLAGRIHEILRRRPYSRLHMIGILYRLGVLRLIRLNPEMTSLDDLLRLCRAKVRRGDDLFHLTFHSSNIGIGGTPYVPTPEARDAFLDRLRGVLDYLVNTCGIVPVTSREYYEIFTRSVRCAIDEEISAVVTREDRNNAVNNEHNCISMES